MLETQSEIDDLDRLLSASRTRASAHLRAIVTDARAPDAAEVIERMRGMQTLAVATVTRAGEPRVSALDGHFLHATWTFGTDHGSAKAAHLRRNSAVSVARIEDQAFGLFAHGVAEPLTPGTPDFDETLAHWAAHYGSSPLEWGDVVMYRLRPSWMVAFRGEPS